MKPNLTVATLTIAAAMLVSTPGRASMVSGDASQGSLGGGPVTLLDSVGFIRGTQIFSDAIDVPTAGTLTVTLSDIPWLAALQNLNCFLSAPGGGLIGAAQNGLFDSVNVQPGTIYVNWYAQAEGPLSLGVYSIAVQLQPQAPPPPPVPLPPAAVLMLSGLAALAIGLRRPRPSLNASC
jgi:hypothetical protein